MRELLHSLEEDDLAATAAAAASAGGSSGGTRVGRGGVTRGPMPPHHPGQHLLDAFARYAGVGGGGGVGGLPPALADQMDQQQGGAQAALHGGQQPDFQIQEASITQLMEMGFSRPHVIEALRHVGSNRPELAMDYLLTHPPPPDPPAPSTMEVGR